MTSPHTVPGGIGQGAVIESHITPAAIQRTADAAPPAPCSEERPPEPSHSSDIMEAYEAAKRAGEANDMRSRRIVRQQWREREGDGDRHQQTEAKYTLPGVLDDQRAMGI